MVDRSFLSVGRDNDVDPLRQDHDWLLVEKIVLVLAAPPRGASNSSFRISLDFEPHTTPFAVPH